MKIAKLTTAVILVAFAATALAGGTAQTKCPFTGGKINKAIYADHDGKRVYFCCPMCIAKFKKDPAPSVKKLEAAGVTLASAPKPQTVCPVMGGKIDTKLFADHDGKRVYLCCAKCLDKFKKDPAKYIKKLEATGVTLAKATKPQTTCPLLGGKIKKTIYADHDGKRVYFCCPMCIGKFKKDPAKYIKKLEAAGVALEKTPATKS